jgi:DGQHR domain-containing protein
MNSDTIKGEDISGVLNKRSKTFVEKTINHTDKDTLEDMLEVEKKDGWRIFKSKRKASSKPKRRAKKKSYKLRKSKEKSELLVNEVWCMLAKMGFHELSKDDEFAITDTKKLVEHKIDIYARDENCVLLLQCEQLDVPGVTKKIDERIDEIKLIRSSIEQNIRKEFDGIKVKWLIATRRISWSVSSKNKAKEENISILSDKDIDYYIKNTQLLKTAARFQLLAYLLKDIGVKGLGAKKVLATEGIMGGAKYYTFLASPADLLKISFVAHKALSGNDDTYQRLVQPQRLKKIGEYIDNGGQFPTNIVINFKQKRPLSFEQKEKQGNLKIGTLKLPNVYGSAWLIDGQHRLYGYAHSQRALKEDTKTFFPILAYHNLDPKKEKDLFVDINSKQVKVSKNVLNEIIADIGWSSSDPVEQLQALRARLAKSLNDSPGPFFERFKNELDKKTSTRCLTAINFTDGLKDGAFFGKVSASDRLLPGPLYDATSKDDEMANSLTKGLDVINGVFVYFEKRSKDNWDLGDAPGGFFGTNLGVRTLLSILSNIIKHIEHKENLDASITSPDELTKLIEPYLEPLSDYVNELSVEEIKGLRSSSSLGKVTANSFQLMVKIRDSIKDFNPNGLDEYVDSLDEEGTKRAASQIRNIHKKISDFVVTKLKANYGEDDWWNRGVPQRIRKECAVRKEEDPNIHNVEEAFNLIHYQQIVVEKENWPMFEHFVGMGEPAKSSTRTKWLRELSDIRNKAMHPERGSLTKEETAKIEEISAHCKEKLV